MVAAGCPDLAAAAGLYFSRCDPARVRAGDLAIVAGSDGAQAFAVVQGAFLFAVGVRGLARVPFSEIVQAFEVG